MTWAEGPAFREPPGRGQNKGRLWLPPGPAGLPRTRRAFPDSCPAAAPRSRAQPPQPQAQIRQSVPRSCPVPAPVRGPAALPGLPVGGSGCAEALLWAGSGKAWSWLEAGWGSPRPKALTFPELEPRPAAPHCGLYGFQELILVNGLHTCILGSVSGITRL